MNLTSAPEILLSIIDKLKDFRETYGTLPDIGFHVSLDIDNNPWLAITYDPEKARRIVKYLGVSGWTAVPSTKHLLNWETIRLGCRITILNAQVVPEVAPHLPASV